MKTNITDAEKHATAIAEAVEKVKAGVAATPDPTAAEGLAKRHERPLTVTLPSDIDEETLSDLLPETNLSSISPEDVIALYKLIVVQAVNLDTSERERDEARADLVRKDIELDQVLQDKESSVKEMEASAEDAHEELARVKQERDQLGFSIIRLSKLILG